MIKGFSSRTSSASRGKNCLVSITSPFIRFIMRSNQGKLWKKHAQICCHSIISGDLSIISLGPSFPCFSSSSSIYSYAVATVWQTHPLSTDDRRRWTSSCLVVAALPHSLGWGWQFCSPSLSLPRRVRDYFALFFWIMSRFRNFRTDLSITEAMKRTTASNPSS